MSVKMRTSNPYLTLHIVYVAILRGECRSDIILYISLSEHTKSSYSFTYAPTGSSPTEPSTHAYS